MNISRKEDEKKRWPVRLSPRARKQFDQILAYVEAAFSEQIADRVEAEFAAAFHMMEHFPEAGEAVPGRPGLRKTSVRRMNVIMYRIMKDRIRVTAITRRGEPYGFGRRANRTS